MHRRTRFVSIVPFGLAAMLLASGGWSRAASRAASGRAAAPPVVESSFSSDGAVITSSVDLPGGKRVLHGLQVRIGPGGWTRQLDVFDQGVLLEARQFHRNGRTFRFQRTGGRSGDGYETVHSTDQKEIASGEIRRRRRWEGTFLEREIVPGTYGKFRLRLQEFRAGKLIRSSPFSVERLRLADPAEDAENWPWDRLDWPRAR